MPLSTSGNTHATGVQNEASRSTRWRPREPRTPTYQTKFVERKCTHETARPIGGSIASDHRTHSVYACNAIMLSRLNNSPNAFWPDPLHRSSGLLSERTTHSQTASVHSTGSGQGWLIKDVNASVKDGVSGTIPGFFSTTFLNFEKVPGSSSSPNGSCSARNRSSTSLTTTEYPSASIRSFSKRSSVATGRSQTTLTIFRCCCARFNALQAHRHSPKGRSHERPVRFSMLVGSQSEIWPNASRSWACRTADDSNGCGSRHARGMTLAPRSKASVVARFRPGLSSTRHVSRTSQITISGLIRNSLASTTLTAIHYRVPITLPLLAPTKRACAYGASFNR